MTADVENRLKGARMGAEASFMVPAVIQKNKSGKALMATVGVKGEKVEGFAHRPDVSNARGN